MPTQALIGRERMKKGIGGETNGSVRRRIKREKVIRMNISKTEWEGKTS